MANEVDISTKTVYRLTLNALNSGPLQHDFGTDDNWDDTFALHLIGILNGITWPANCSVSMEKIVTNVSDTLLDLTITPLAF